MSSARGGPRSSRPSSVPLPGITLRAAQRIGRHLRTPDAVASLYDARSGRAGDRATIVAVLLRRILDALEADGVLPADLAVELTAELDELECPAELEELEVELCPWCDRPLRVRAGVRLRRARGRRRLVRSSRP